MALAKNIRYLRKKKNWSQEYIAEKLGYKSYTTIQKWEMGASEPPLKKLKELAELFHVDMDDLANKDLELSECVHFVIDTSGSMGGYALSNYTSYIDNFMKGYLPSEPAQKEHALKNIYKNLRQLKSGLFHGLKISDIDTSCVSEYQKGNCEPLFNTIMHVVQETDLQIDDLKKPFLPHPSNDMALYYDAGPDTQKDYSPHVLHADLLNTDNDILLKVTQKSEHSRLLDSYRRLAKYYQALSDPELLYSILDAIANVPEKDLPKVQSLMKVFIEKKDMEE